MPKIPNASRPKPEPPKSPEPIEGVGLLYSFPESSNISIVRYGPEEQHLWVTFGNGDTYSYDEVPPAAFQAFIDASRTSAGAAFHRLIRLGGFKATKESEYEQPPLNEATVIRRTAVFVKAEPPPP